MAQEQGLTIAYTRVSGVSQKPDLTNQVKALEAYCQQHSVKVDEWLSDIGSGLNYKRKQFNRLMELVELGLVRRLVIAHKDRLVRFGVERNALAQKWVKRSAVKQVRRCCNTSYYILESSRKGVS